MFIGCIYADINLTLFTFKVHHDFFLGVVDRGSKSYVGGQVSYNDYEDKTKVSLLELGEIGIRLGFNDVVEFGYKIPVDGVFIQDDNDILDMVSALKIGK